MSFERRLNAGDFSTSSGGNSPNKARHVPTFIRVTKCVRQGELSRHDRRRLERICRRLGRTASPIPGGIHGQKRNTLTRSSGPGSSQANPTNNKSSSGFCFSLCLCLSVENKISNGNGIFFDKQKHQRIETTKWSTTYPAGRKYPNLSRPRFNSPDSCTASMGGARMFETCTGVSSLNTTTINKYHRNSV